MFLWYKGIFFRKRLLAGPCACPLGILAGPCAFLPWILAGPCACQHKILAGPDIYNKGIIIYSRLLCKCLPEDINRLIKGIFGTLCHYKSRSQPLFNITEIFSWFYSTHMVEGLVTTKIMWCCMSSSIKLNISVTLLVILTCCYSKRNWTIVSDVLSVSACLLRKKTGPCAFLLMILALLGYWQVHVPASLGYWHVHTYITIEWESSQDCCVSHFLK